MLLGRNIENMNTSYRRNNTWNMGHIVFVVWEISQEHTFILYLALINFREEPMQLKKRKSLDIQSLHVNVYFFSNNMFHLFHICCHFWQLGKYFRASCMLFVNFTSLQFHQCFFWKFFWKFRTIVRSICMAKLIRLAIVLEIVMEIDQL